MKKFHPFSLPKRQLRFLRIQWPRHRRTRTVFLQLEQLEDRITPSRFIRSGLDEVALEIRLHESLEGVLAEERPSALPLGGGSGPQHAPEGGGGGGGGGGSASGPGGDSGVMGGGGGTNNQFANAGAPTGGGQTAKAAPAQPATVSVGPGFGHRTTTTHHATVHTTPHRVVHHSSAPASAQDITVSTTTSQLTSGPFTVSGVSYAVPSMQYANDVVANVTYSDTTVPAADLLATVTWGDGGSSTGLVLGQNGSFAVTGTHSFSASATYYPSVTVTDNLGNSVTLTSTLYVGTSANPTDNPALPTLLAQDPPISATEGTSGNFTIGTFTDSDNNTSASAYSIGANGISWGDGTSSSGTVTGTNPFTVSASHTYAEEGSYAVSAVVNDSDNNQFTINTTSVVMDAALSVVSTSPPSNVSSGNSFTANQMVTFSDADANGTAGDYSAIVAWGDGLSSAGTIGTSGSNFAVSASHTYLNGGTYTATVTIKDAGGASVSTTVNISVSGITSTPKNLTWTVGQPYNNQAVATLTDTNSNPTFSNTVINWGDGTTSSGSVAGSQVLGTHTYSRQGYYALTYTTTDNYGAKGYTLTNVNVTHGTLAATNQLPSGSQSSPIYVGNTASFTDSDNDQTTSDFTAQISWGDGSSSAATNILVSNGHLYVSGSHFYAAGNGSYTVSTAITDVDGSTVTSTGTLTINQGGQLALTPRTNLTGTEGIALSNLTLATFTDSDGNTSSFSYGNSTISWGDGTSSSTATITGTGPFTLSGSHTYADEGSYQVQITVRDMDGAQCIGSTTIAVGDGTITPTGKSLSATAGAPLNATALATFTTQDTAAPVTDFSALVNWGDNTPPTAAYISGSGGSYTVTGGHLYASAANETAVITITDVGGATASVNTTINVTAPSATLTVNPVSATEGAGYSGTLATFTPASGTGNDSFVASLGWADGAVTYGTLTSNGQGGFNITAAAHVYADESNVNNPETLTVTVLDSTTGSIAARGTASVTVADASLSATAKAITAWPNQTTGLIAVATFTDANSAAPASDFNESINWGDGSGTSAGTVLPTVGGPAGAFTVWGQHT
jgi:hypothetical protein